MRKTILLSAGSLVILAIIGAAVYAVVRNANPIPADTDLKIYALNLADLRRYNFVTETVFPKGKNSQYARAGYLVNFDNSAWVESRDDNAYRDLSNSVLLYDSVEELKKDFAQQGQNLQKLDIEKIGDESLAFVSGKIVVIWFYKKNLLASIAIQNGMLEDAVRYAKIVEAKIQ